MKMLILGILFSFILTQITIAQTEPKPKTSSYFGIYGNINTNIHNFESINSKPNYDLGAILGGDSKKIDLRFQFSQYKYSFDNELDEYSAKDNHIFLFMDMKFIRKMNYDFYFCPI